MNKSLPSSITIEEAVARMVNVSNIPKESNLIDYLATWAFNAETEYEEAKKNGLPSKELELIELRV